MKILTFILLLSTSLIYGQSDFNSLLENVQSLKTPYTSEYNSESHIRKKILTQKDSLFLVRKLISIQPTILNNIINSPFGSLDCKDFKECLDFKNLKEIAIIGFIKVDSSNYLLHIILTPNGRYSMSKGILVSMNKLGELNDWFFANLETDGNPNGNVSRDFKIDNNLNITVSETSWGRNNINYSLEAVYRVFRYVNSEENRNKEHEDYDYDNSLENKIEYFDLQEGKFELTKLCIDI